MYKIKKKDLNTSIQKTTLIMKKFVFALTVLTLLVLSAYGVSAVIAGQLTGTEIAVGDGHSLLITDKGGVSSWGSNSKGQ